MRTTNLITDFLIIGIIGFLCLSTPYFIIRPEKLNYFTSLEMANSGIFWAVATILNYILGILFYQLSNYGVKKLAKIFFLSPISNIKGKVKQETGISYHFALQTIVINSKNSYDYLSYRRTIIRIFNALIFACFIFILLHIIYSLRLFFFTNIPLQYSISNIWIVVGTFVLGIFVRSIYIKQYKGYIDAIINFVKIIETNDIQNPNN